MKCTGLLGATKFKAILQDRFRYGRSRSRALGTLLECPQLAHRWHGERGWGPVSIWVGGTFRGAVRALLAPFAHVASSPVEGLSHGDGQRPDIP